jgi:flagellar biosynthesis protein FlhB
MSDSFQEKTEEPSQKKLGDSRKKGQVAKSQDFNAGGMLLLSLLFLFFFLNIFLKNSLFSLKLSSTI